MQRGKKSVEESRARVLNDILKAQSGSKNGYAQALKEIRAEQKQSHWIWYIWPCLQQLRPGTSRPQYLLPDLDAARAYLQEATLRQRLLEITVAATEHLRKGVEARKLFGVGGDWVKFHETCTFFAVAAQLNGDEEVMAVCCEGLAVPPYKGVLNEPTMQLIVGEYGYRQLKTLRSISDLTPPSEHKGQSLQTQDAELGAEKGSSLSSGAVS